MDRVVWGVGGVTRRVAHRTDRSHLVDGERLDDGTLDGRVDPVHPLPLGEQGQGGRPVGEPGRLAGPLLPLVPTTAALGTKS